MLPGRFSSAARAGAAGCLWLALVLLGAPPAAADAGAPAPIIPTHIVIPRIGVDAPVEQVGLTAQKAVENPRQWDDAGWYNLGYAPGAAGNAAIVGHLDSTQGPAVFWRVGRLQAGDQVLVDNGTSTLTFLVQAIETYPADQSPMVTVYGPSDIPRLNLVTCTGDWNPDTQRYSDRLVVYTVLQGFGSSPSNAACRFVLGFQTIHDLIADRVGECVDSESHNPDNGDALQHTGGGLLVWRKADNWTAFTDGYQTWVNGPSGLQQRLNRQRFPWEANPDGLPVVGPG